MHHIYRLRDDGLMVLTVAVKWLSGDSRWRWSGQTRSQQRDEQGADTDGQQ